MARNEKSKFVDRSEIMTSYTRKTVGWTVMTIVVALWVFVVFFFDGILGNIAREKLIEDVAQATHNEYQLSFTDFVYHRGVLDATGTEIKRVAYRAGEQGTTLKDLGIATVHVTGISWWEILFGKPIQLSILRTSQPRIYLCRIAQGEANWKLLPPYIPPAPSPIKNVWIGLDSVFIPNALIYGQDKTANILSGVFTFNLQKFSYDSKSNAPLHLATKHFDLTVPWIQYADSSGQYFVRAMHITSVDSVLAVDTFSYASGKNSTVFRGSGVRVAGIGFVRLAAGNGLTVRSLKTRTWAANVTTKQDTAHHSPSGLPWQDRLARSVSFPIRIDSLDLNGGALDVLMAPSSHVGAQDLALHAMHFDFDTGAPAKQPGFAQALAIAASDAQYNAKGVAAQVKNFSGNIQDSLVTVGTAVYYPSGIQKGKSPMQLSDLRINGIGFDSLLSGSAILAHSIRARAWKISEWPSGIKSKKSKRASRTIWAMQQGIAKSIGIPIRISRIELTDGTMRVASPTILADGASIDAVGFNLDSSNAASKRLFFSKDVSVKASRFRYADKGRLNEIDLRGAHTRLSSRSISAGMADYVSRSSFEPWINSTAYQFHNLDFRGIDFAGLLDSKRIALGTVKASRWAIERTSDTVSPPPSSTAPAKSKGGWTIPITVGHADLPNGTIVFRERDTTPSGFSPTLTSKITKLDLTRFRFLPPKGKRLRLNFDQVLCVMPSFSYAPLDGFYTAEIRNMKANLKDSLITMDSLNYEPKYSKEEFAALHKYARGRTDFRLAKVQIIDIDARRMINGGGIVIKKFISPSLWLDYYKDKRVPANPHPAPAVMPNTIMRSLNLPITIDAIVIKDGHILIEEHTINGAPPGDFTFQHVSVSAAPITFDSASPLVDTPTVFHLSGIFLGQSPTRATLIYPLHDSAFNLTVHGTVGPFDARQLNQYLVNAVRVQVTSGQFHHGDIKVNITNGVAHTTVLPIYDHFKLKVLPPNPGDPPDIEESVKTFLANLIVLRDDNPDEDGGPPKVGVTTLARQKPIEFFQFLWFAIRKSLGAVVGGIK